jgi:hypothetical protein
VQRKFSGEGIYKPVEVLRLVGRGKLLLFLVEEGEYISCIKLSLENQLNHSPCDIMDGHRGGML